jgi:cell wall-associated NlpC family hydrolase
MIGTHLRRDADQQANEGIAVPFEELAFGDLLFFDTRSSDADIMNGKLDPHVSHVCLALDRMTMINASFSGGGLSLRSFDPQSPHFSPTYERRFLGSRRYVTSDS